MGFGDIIKRSWRITWHYRALWLLGLFAGITGWSSSGGSSGNSGNSFSNSTSRGLGSSGSEQQFLSFVERAVPVLIAVGLAIFVISILWWILGIAARGGLVQAVNEIEERRQPFLGAAWNAGFGKFWTIFGLELLLKLPLAIVAIGIVAAVLVPLITALIRTGGDLSSSSAASIIAPMCGGLAIGIPLLLVLSFVFGIMYVIALRFVMLYDMGAVDAARESWRAFRGRFKDTALMWLINWGLNIVAGLVIAIPIVILVIALVLPAAIAGGTGHWSALAVSIGVLVLVVLAISFLYTAIWGTFTSALWTVFFRRFTGMEARSLEQIPRRPAPQPAPAAVQQGSGLLRNSRS